MKQLFQLAMLIAAAAYTGAGARAQAPQPETAAPTVLSAPVHPDPYIPPGMRKPPRDGAAGPVLQFHAMQKLKRRFEEADLNGDGYLSRDEAHKAGLGFVEKNFDHIDSAQRGSVNFEDLKAFIIQRREEARSR
ncbi:EF-hand domain-containing protein [Duganella sp. Dugasp56]|uniref:EF-hand domain-containing protein n=1 Tax=Duganella sp. Dugasp56 TaxID=3243046 RepID=UPI0039AFE64A